MIGISKLYCGTVEPSDALRYGRHSKDLPSHLLQFSKDKRPVVVWNTTRKCNLKCVHCYAHATNQAETNELSTVEGKRLIDDLAPASRVLDVVNIDELRAIARRTRAQISGSKGDLIQTDRTLRIRCRSEERRRLWP